VRALKSVTHFGVYAPNIFVSQSFSAVFDMMTGAPTPALVPVKSRESLIKSTKMRDGNHV